MKHKRKDMCDICKRWDNDYQVIGNLTICVNCMKEGKVFVQESLDVSLGGVKVYGNAKTKVRSPK